MEGKGRGMQGRVIPLKERQWANRTARQQLLDVAAQHARVQGVSVVEYLRQLQEQARRKEKGRDVQTPLRAPKEKYAYLTKREVDALFEHIADLRDRTLFGTIYYLGLRASEAGLLLRDEVNLRTKRVYVRRLKGSTGGERVMTGDCRRLLQRYLAQRWDDLPYLFPSRNHRPLSRQRIDALYRSYARRAGLPPYKQHVHCLRHSIATHMLDAGRSLEEVQDHLGHKSIRSTQVYAKISDARRERVAVALELAPEVAKIGSQQAKRRR